MNLAPRSIITAPTYDPAFTDERPGMMRCRARYQIKVYVYDNITRRKLVSPGMRACRILSWAPAVYLGLACNARRTYARQRPECRFTRALPGLPQDGILIVSLSMI